MTIFLIIVFTPILALLAIIYYPRFKTELGIKYESYPTTKWSHGSFPNPDNVVKGYFWTPVSGLKKFKYDEKGKNCVYINNFRMDQDFINKSKIPNFLVKKYEKFAVGFSPLQMTQTLLFIGKMGTGKTVMLFSMLKQKFYNRAIIHQIKVGDFTGHFYREGHDIIMNPFEERAHLWDVMSEHEGIIATFFENYMNAIMGEKKDFFSTAANRIYNQTMHKIKIQYKDATSAQKWLVFIKAIKDLLHEMETGDKNSKHDVGSTMEQVVESLEIMAWQMQQKNTKSFTIKEFFEKKDQCKLFLDNQAEHKKALTPLFSAFLAAFAKAQMGRDLTKTDFTLYAIDEYLSLVSTVDDDTRTALHTAIRDRGGILMSFIQYIPKKNIELEQQLTSSAFAWFIFGVIEKGTIQMLKDTVGEVEYIYTDESRSGDKSTYSKKEVKKNLITTDIINSLASEYACVVYIPNNKILYKGYSPEPILPQRNEKIIPLNRNEFYAMKYNSDDEELIDVKSIKFEDLFKKREKKMSKLDEYKMYKKFCAAKKEGKIEEFKEEELTKEFKTQKVDFDLMFEKYIPKDTVISNKMKMLSVEERKDLLEKWNSFDENDLSSQLKFLEENDLFGAVPGIFNFDGDVDIADNF